MGLCLWALPAAAHVRYDVRVTLTPPQVQGLVVELHQDALAPQLVIANRSGKQLEILDTEGRAFLRIGPHGTEADVAAEAFHLSRISGGATAPPGTLSATPRWRTVNRESSYGWFDPRIAVASLPVPTAIQDAGRASGDELSFGEWQIPARLGEETLSLRGSFRFVPPAVGQVRNLLLSPAEPAPGVQVQVTPGPVPAILLSNRSPQTVSVLDDRGKPFIRIGPNGVSADTSSPAWSAARTGAQPSGQGWQKLSKVPSHIWREPRAAYTGKMPRQRSALRLGEWRVPLRIGEEAVELHGAHEWQPSSTRVAPIRH